MVSSKPKVIPTLRRVALEFNLAGYNDRHHSTLRPLCQPESFWYGPHGLVDSSHRFPNLARSPRPAAGTMFRASMPIFHRISLPCANPSDKQSWTRHRVLPRFDGIDIAASPWKRAGRWREEEGTDGPPHKPILL